MSTSGHTLSFQVLSDAFASVVSGNGMRSMLSFTFAGSTLHACIPCCLNTIS